MKFHIDEISHLAQSNTSFIRKLDICGEKIIVVRFVNVPFDVRLKYKEFRNGVIEFQISGNMVKRALVRASAGMVLKKSRLDVSRFLSISGDVIMIRINEFLKNRIADMKGIQLTGFEINGKEIAVHLEKQGKR